MAKAKPALPAVFYQYNATVSHVVDGDTVSLDVDLGFFVWVRMSCRLLGIDAPEKDTVAGAAAKLYLTKMLPPGTAVVIDSTHADKYGGRFDAKVWKAETGENVADTLVKAGQAKGWIMGAAPKPYKLPGRG